MANRNTKRKNKLARKERAARRRTIAEHKAKGGR